MIAVDTMRYHVHFTKKSSGLHDAIHFLRVSKPRIPKLPFANNKKALHSVLETAYSDTFLRKMMELKTAQHPDI